MKAKPLRLVPRPQRLDGIVGYRSERRHLGQESPVRAPEPKLAVGLSIHLVALLVDRAVVAATLCRAPDYAEFERDLDGEADLGIGIISRSWRIVTSTPGAHRERRSPCQPRHPPFE